MTGRDENECGNWGTRGAPGREHGARGRAFAERTAARAGAVVCAAFSSRGAGSTDRVSSE